MLTSPPHDQLLGLDHALAGELRQHVADGVGRHGHLSGILGVVAPDLELDARVPPQYAAVVGHPTRTVGDGLRSESALRADPGQPDMRRVHIRGLLGREPVEIKVLERALVHEDRLHRLEKAHQSVTACAK